MTFALFCLLVLSLACMMGAVYPNRYAKSCRRCACWVQAGEGVIRKEAGGWVTYCKNHSPERLAPPQTRPTVTNRLNADGSLTWNYDAAQLPLLRSFPGYRNRKIGESWQTSVSIADADLRRSIEIAEQLGMEVAPELRERLESHTTDNKLIQAAIKRADVEGKPLYPFQIDGAAWLTQGKLRLLGDDMGLGKTVQALAALDASKPAMAVVPNPVKYNWRNECRRWRPDLTPVVLDAGEFRYPRKGEVVIINPQALPERFGKVEIRKQGYKKVKETVFAIKETDKAVLKGVQIIGDEAHLYKNSKALRSIRFRTLCLLALGLPEFIGRELSKEEGEAMATGTLPDGAGSIFALTGTPLLTRATDLWGVLNSACMAEAVFRHFGNFYKLFNASKGRFGTIWGMPKPEVPELLRRVMLRRMKTEVLKDLPAKTYTDMECNEIDRQLEREMDELWEEYGDYLQTADKEDALPPFEEFSKIRRKLAESRIPQMLEFVENAEEQDQPLVVFSAHRAPIEALLTDNEDTRAIITGDTKPEERQRIVDDFQAGRIKTIGLTIAAGGVGITLTRASTVLFVDLDWTPALNVQAEDRVCRIGQTANSVQIIRMVSTHVLDKHVQKLIIRKISLIFASVENRLKVEGKAGGQKIETEEEYQARMERMAQEDAEEEEREKQAERATVERKVNSIARRMRDKIGDWIGQDMTPAHKDAIRRCFNALADLDPDFAFELNGVGFNKPDSYLARWLSHSLGTDEEYRAMWGLIYKYRRQMGERFPILWPRKK